MAAWRFGIFVCILMCLCLDLATSINDEGRALMRFKDEVEFDTYGALSDWKAEGSANPCLWFGVHCSGGKVTALSLSNLSLKGKLAAEIGQLIHLKSLCLHNNSFYGVIPQEIRSLQNLEVLDLGHNNLSSPLPSELSSIFSLKILILRSNKFIDSMPHDLHKLTLLSEHLTEEEIALRKRPIASNVEDTSFEGPLHMVKQYKRRRLLDSPAPPPSQNHRHHRHKHNTSSRSLAPSSSPAPALSLAPTISPVISPSPTPSISFPPPPMKNIEVPRPSPSPVIKPPSAQPANTHRVDATPPSVPIMSLNSPSPAAPLHTTAKHTISLTTVFSIVGAVTFLLALSLVYAFCWQANKVSIKPWATGLSGQLQKALVTGVSALKRSELEVACEHFSNVIGSLVDCRLYKGTLSSGVEIAVISSTANSAKWWSKQSESQFRKKVMELSKVNHKNFVNLLGFCEEEEPFSRMMVFEYAPNGTLFEHLHVKEAEHLDWGTRLRIAMGIAYCLEHMHQLNPPVILRNLDSSTIYLTDDYAAKISDLEFWSETKETEPPSEILDPFAELPSTESTVYIFGIILLEILSGKLPFSEEYGKLELWASFYLNAERPLKEFIDPTLSTFNEETATALCKVISSCIQPDPKERPTMREVANRLREITSMAPDGATPKVSPLWWAELELISSEVN